MNTSGGRANNQDANRILFENTWVTCINRMWQSAIDKRVLLKRAQLLTDIRDFFKVKSVLEVEVPVIGFSTVTDPNLSSLTTCVGGKDFFLQTSPEFFMKRLLASGSGPIYYLGKAFRDDEHGRRHNPEFTMLEWYREGFDDRLLANELVALVRTLAPDVEVEIYSYASIFERHIGLDPHLASAEELEEKAKVILDVSWRFADKNTWLDLLFSHVIEPKMKNLCIIFDYPASQCALARIEVNTEGVEVAKRFEVFWKGVELANGYWELTDPCIQKQRFLIDLEQRKKMGYDLPDIDNKFVAALESGLPECSGVALGVDRLFMCLLDTDDIQKAIAFPFSRV